MSVKVRKGRLTTFSEILFGISSLARISHRPGYHSDFGQDAEHKADGKGWAG